MHYSDGREARLGDKVTLGHDEGGIVVCAIDRGEYSDGYTKADWDYLGTGILVNFPLHGLIHYERPEPGLQLVARA